MKEDKVQSESSIALAASQSERFKYLPFFCTCSPCLFAEDVHARSQRVSFKGFHFQSYVHVAYEPSSSLLRPLWLLNLSSPIQKKLMPRRKQKCLWHCHCTCPEVHHQNSQTAEPGHHIYHAPDAIIFRFRHQTAYIHCKNWSCITWTRPTVESCSSIWSIGDGRKVCTPLFGILQNSISHCTVDQIFRNIP